MGTIKVADVYVKFRPDEVHLELPIGCNQCAFDKQQTLQLAAALTERYGGGDAIKEAVIAERLRLQDFFTWLSLDYTHYADLLWKDKDGNCHSHQKLYNEYLIKKGVQP